LYSIAYEQIVPLKSFYFKLVLKNFVDISHFSTGPLHNFSWNA